MIFLSLACCEESLLVMLKEALFCHSPPPPPSKVIRFFNAQTGDLHFSLERSEKIATIHWRQGSQGPWLEFEAELDAKS